MAQGHRRRGLHFPFSETPRFDSHQRALKFLRGAGDHIDGGEDAVAAIKRGRRPANDLDALDQRHIQREILLHPGRLAEYVVRHVVPVHHNQEARPEITW